MSLGQNWTICSLVRKTAKTMNKIVLAAIIALSVSCWRLNAQNEIGYDPEVFALESGRGQLSKEYFGVKLADVKKDDKGLYQLSDSQRETITRNILGDHPCSLQWISWKRFGKVTFTKTTDGRIYCKGGQNGDNGDYLKIDGYVTVVTPLHIRITGTIITKVSHINGGKPYTRKGTYNFTIAGARKYWRMREMNNPSPDGGTDYVDIYF